MFIIIRNFMQASVIFYNTVVKIKPLYWVFLTLLQLLFHSLHIIRFNAVP